MFYIVESSKSFYEACFDLDPVVQRLGFVVLHAYDLSEILSHKGIELDEDCKVFEIGSYRYAEKLLSANIQFSLTFPWRISVFTENGATKIGLRRPDSLPTGVGEKAKLAETLAEIEAKMMMIVDETR